jgi:hypothetical protein
MTCGGASSLARPCVAEQGNSRKDRYALLSPLLLARLRMWWRVDHARGKLLNGGWLYRASWIYPS